MGASPSISAQAGESASVFGCRGINPNQAFGQKNKVKTNRNKPKIESGSIQVEERATTSFGVLARFTTFHVA
jgi:hypothetical protein